MNRYSVVDIILNLGSEDLNSSPHFIIYYHLLPPSRLASVSSGEVGVVLETSFAELL